MTYKLTTAQAMMIILHYNNYILTKHMFVFITRAMTSSSVRRYAKNM